jgi:hypothetical protein
MKVVLTLLAVLLGCLSLGALMSFTKRADWLDLGMTILLGWAAVGVWKAARR